MRLLTALSKLKQLETLYSKTKGENHSIQMATQDSQQINTRKNMYLTPC